LEASEHRGAAERLRSEVAEVNWFHTIDLGHGVVTPGTDESQAKLAQIRLPQDLGGKSVLDVGAWDGFFSFEAERRGAARVVAVDPATWRRAPDEEGWGSKAGFDLARRALSSQVEAVDLDLLDLTPERVGTFDVVLFLGIFYHLPDPWPILDRVASVTGELLILESHVDMLDLRRPAMAFYPGAEVDGDASNWWGANPRLFDAVLRHRGFSRIEQVHGESLPRRLARSAYRRSKGERFRASQGRAVMHAWR